MASQSPYRGLPSVDRVLSEASIRDLCDEVSRDLVVELVRAELASARKAVGNGAQAPALDSIVAAVRASAAERLSRWPRAVINATGVVVHTNLGRAPLSREAVEAAASAAAGYSDLEFDLNTGARGSRNAYAGRLLAQVTGAEAGIAVNNNASAVMLGLAAMAAGREVIVSRGEAVEIGGGFRVPDVLRQSGATLVDVGTTNKTYLSDYEAAITGDTGAFLSVHSSNFKVVGFTEAPSIADLVSLGRSYNVPVLHDVGSGCLLDTSEYGLAHEPTVQESVDAGAELVFFSGDKLLGGPQAGLVVGKREAVARLARHPLARAVRIDKLGLAALVATLLHYVRREAPQKVPVWQMISASIGSLDYRARLWRERIGGPLSIVDSTSAIGGGSLPGETLSTRALSIDGASLEGGAHALTTRLRAGNPPVVGRVEANCLLLDPRTVLPTQDNALIAALTSALNAGRSLPQSANSHRSSLPQSAGEG